MTVRRNGKPVAADEEDIFLADVVADPNERTNLADDPALADVKKDLRDRLLRHVANAYEPPFVPARRASELGLH